MGIVTLALIGAIFLIYFAFTMGFWLLAVDMSAHRTSFHRRRLLDALCALEGNSQLRADAKLVDILAPLERSGSLSKLTRNSIENEFKKLSTTAPILGQLEEAERRERAFAIAAWPSIMPGANGLEATDSRKEMERQEKYRLEQDSSIPHARTILSTIETGDSATGASEHPADRVFEQFRADIGKRRRLIVEVALRMVPYLQGALAGCIDTIGRGTAIGLVVGFFIGFTRAGDSSLLLDGIAQSSLQMAAFFAVASTLLFSVRLYTAARKEGMKNPFFSSLSFVVMIALFITEIAIAYAAGS